MIDPVDAQDGLEFEEGKVTCICGRVLWLFYNGGELDRRQCNCGVILYTEHIGTVLRVDTSQVSG